MLRRMDAAEFRRILEKLDFSHAEAAGMLDLSIRQISRFATGTFPVPVAVELALRYLLLRRRPPEPAPAETPAPIVPTSPPAADPAPPTSSRLRGDLDLLQRMAAAKTRS